MKGIPGPALATRSDYERLHKMALDGELRPREVEKLRRYWQALLDEPEYRVVESGDDDEEDRRVQYKRVEDDRALIYRLGFTVDEVENKIKELP